jgi:hypothetical protein
VAALRATPTLRAVATLPATATLSAVSTLPATATLSAVPTLPTEAIAPAAEGALAEFFSSSARVSLPVMVGMVPELVSSVHTLTRQAAR